MNFGGKEEHEQRAQVMAILELALKALPIPDHTGSLKDGQGAPLEENDCACDLHRAHKSLRSTLKEINSHQCFHCTNFDPALGAVGARRAS